MIRARVLTPWGIDAEGLTRSQLEIDYPVAVGGPLLSSEDVLDQDAMTLPNTPNANIREIVCTDAAFATIAADSRYAVLWKEGDEGLPPTQATKDAVDAWLTARSLAANVNQSTGAALETVVATTVRALPNKYKILAIMPVSKVTAIETWLKANVNPAISSANWPELNADGSNAAATHRLMIDTFDGTSAQAVLDKMCQLASVPSMSAEDWLNQTKAWKIAWLATVHDAILASNLATYLLLMTDDPTQALADMNLQYRT